MINGYRILGTDLALKKLEATIDYLLDSFTEKELKNLAIKTEEIIELISKNPHMFPGSEIKKNLRKVVVAKYNTMYYRIKGESIEIISFFSNRQSPDKRKLE